MISLLGGSTLGGQVWDEAAGAPPVPETPLERPSDLVRGPYVRLFEWMNIKTGANLIRLCDWIAHEPDDTPGQVEFEGNTYTTMAVRSGTIASDIESGLPTLRVTVADPGRILFRLLRPIPRTDITCRIVIVPVGGIDDPAEKIIDRTMTLRKVGSSDSPEALICALGAPPVFNIRHPRNQVSRKLCFAPYSLRHRNVPASYCTYPSNRMGLQTAELLSTAGDGPKNLTEFQFGWWASNLDGGNCEAEVGAIPSGYPGTDDRALTILKNGTDLRHDDSVQLAPTFTRLLDADVDGALDFYAKVWRDFADTENKKDDQWWGIYVKSGADNNDRLIFALRNAGVATTLNVEVFVRQISDGVASPDVVIAWPTNHNTLRISYDGAGNWVFYSRFEKPTERTYAHSGEDDWTQLTTLSWTPSPAPTVFRAGFICGSDETVEAKDVGASCFYIHFLKGGLATCDRTDDGPNGCDVHKNGQQFQGVPVAPAKL